ncbi:MAG TPA: tyrosine-type recombinase/integrase [Terracidiphilus sp.]
MSRPASLDRIFDEQLESLAVALRPSTIAYYRSAVHRFLRYLRTAYPQLHRASQLRRDPHILGWLRSLGQETPPLSNRSRRACLMCVRRLLDDLISNGQPLPEGLILRQDFPPRDLYLPKPLSPENDRLLDQQLRQTDDLHSNALLLLRATGMRIGECLRLHTDCLRHLGPHPDQDDQWALHVPLGKLHSERWVPADDRIRQMVARILALRGTAAVTQSDTSSDWLLQEPDGRRVSYQRMWQALAETARRAGCSAPVRPHQLRHTFASEMVRLGISLPALKELLGHRDIRMTMVYVAVTQNDLQRQYHLARQALCRLHSMPELPMHQPPTLVTSANIPSVLRSLAATRHLLEMFRRQLESEKARRKLARLANRLAKIEAELHQLPTHLK